MQVPSVISDPPSAAELQRYAAELHDLYHNAPCGYHCLNAEGFYVRVNDMELAWLGYSREELIGKKRLLDLLAEESRPRYKQGFQDFLRQGYLHEMEISLQRKDGSLLIAMLSATALLDSRGRFVMSRSVLQDISGCHKAMHEQINTREHLRELSQHLEQIREEEKRSIARELHDELGCLLSTLRLDISRLHKKLPQPLNQATSDMLTMLDSAVHTTRRLVTQLNPTILEDLGLVAALKWLLREFSRRSGLESCFEILGEEMLLSQPINLTLFRVAQEALTNIIRHAAASRIDVALIYEDGLMIMEIYDDGIGIDLDSLKQSSSHGVRGMRERIHAIGGRFSLARHAIRGTTLQARIPFSGEIAA